MSRSKVFSKTVATTGIAFACAMLLLFPKQFASSFLAGLSVWAANVLPVVFPFVFFSHIITENLRPDRKRQNVCAYFLSILCGYPMGAKLCADMSRKNLLGDKAVFSTLLLTSNAGAVFVASTVGAFFLKDATATVCLFAAHYASAVICSLIYSKTTVKTPYVAPNALKTTDESKMLSSVLSILCVGGYIAVFYTLCDMFVFLFPQAQQGFSVAVLGLCEMTNGCRLASALPLSAATPLCCCFISFGGLCVFAQTYEYVKQIGVKAGDYLFAKATQGAVALILCHALCAFSGV